MDKTKLAVENYIFALKQLRRASAKLNELGVSTPIVSQEIHVCLAKQPIWLKLKEIAGNPKCKVDIINDDIYPAKESFMYGETKIFRLLSGGN